MVMLVLLLSFVGCKKGDTGDTGPAGTNGVNGINGNANVHTSTTTIPSNEWILNGNIYEATILNSNINQDILDHGTVEVFVSTNGTEWIALPFSINNVEFSYAYSIGTVSLDYSLGSGATPSSLPNNDQFKVVVIAGSARILNPDVNFKNYNEIKSAFKLPN